MKNSGIEWIGEIPDSWKLVRFKDICVNKKEIAGESSEKYERLALTLGGVIKRPKYDSDGLQPKEFDGYQIICENDFIFKMIDLQNISTSRVGLSPYCGLVSPAYIRFSSREEGQYNEYVYYFLMSMYYNCVYNNLGGNGVRSALNATDIGQLVIPFPAIEKQKKIVAFLENAFKKIDKLIEVQQAQIEKLKEYKQSVITEAVTKGLNPNAPMKDSGIEWIGKIPEGWMTPKIKYFSSIESGGTPDRTHFEYWNGTINWFKTGELHNDEIFSSEEKITEKAIAETAAKIFPENTILVAMYGQGKTRGMTALLKKESATNQACAGIQLIKDGFVVEYMWWTLMGAYNSLRERASGSGQPNLSVSLISEFEIPMPSIEEQEKIIVYLKDKCAKIDKLIALKQSKIEKLQEYKKSLIYEYVTGKKEVI